MGHDRAAFSIHSSLLSRLSAALYALASGGMKESSEGPVTFEDVEKDIFSRFVQFVFTGAYTSFAPAEKDGLTVTASVEKGLDIRPVTIEQSDVKARSDSTALFDLPRNNEIDAPQLPFSLISYKKPAVWGIFGTSSHFCKQHQPGSQIFSKRKFDTAACDCGPSENKRKFISGFIEKHVDFAGNSRNDNWPNTGKTKSNPGTLSLEHVFLGHAKIWAFAHRFAITSLMDLAYSQLAYELAEWVISPSAFVPEFGGLVRYVYGNRTDRGCQLRRLVAEFAACVVEDVNDLEGWTMLLEEVPTFTADLVNLMTDRVC